MSYYSKLDVKKLFSQNIFNTMDTVKALPPKLPRPSIITSSTDENTSKQQLRSLEPVSKK